MKRMLTLLFMVALFLGVKAQVLFNQDFESGTLDPMKAVDVDGKTVNANVASFCGPTFTVVQQAATNKAVVSTSWFEPVGQADDWLISPPITVTSANTFVSWRAYSPDANYRDGYQVRISTTNDSIASFGTLALNVAAELTTWTTRSIRLTNYVGQTIYVAWRNNSTDKYLLYMDDFKAEILKGNNVIVKNLTFEKYNPVATEVPIKISIENHGANPVTSLFFDYNAGGYTYTDTVTGLNVAPLKSLDLTHSISHVVGYNEYPISVEVRSPNGIADEDSTNNTITRYMYGISEQLPKKVVVEEATGTWCIWCPRGAVNMDLIWGKYPDLVMPIAVHNYDPMTVADYDTPFSASVSGYPSGHVDRKTRDIDPLNFETAVLDIQNRLVPVQVTTEVTWNSETRSANIRGTAHSSIETEHNAFRFVCVITEDGVHGTDAGYAQANI
ncbi:MAG TPA: choice-of-anchor J domain-containing protein, partial [Saprospiraceae bacterium]|nr:choice-of-anchor J domain-containing protein [Saprospiraceae bacterium]